MNKWSPPPELNQPFPRRFRISGSIQFSFALFTVTFLGLAILAPMIKYKDAHKMAILKTRGVAAEGTVVNRYTTYNRRHNPSYCVVSRFQAPPASGALAAVYLATECLHGDEYEDEYENVKIGQNVPIIYDPFQPGQAALNLNARVHTNDPQYHMFVLMKKVGAVCGLTYVLIMAVILRIYFKERKLVMWGHAAAATIADRSSNIATRTTYQFMDASGKTVAGVAYLPSKAQSKRDKVRKYLAKITDNPTALYDPRDSSKNMLYRSGRIDWHLPQMETGKSSRG